MEEDIKILEDFIKYFEAEAVSRKYRRNISITVGEDDIEAIENLIKRIPKFRNGARRRINKMTDEEIREIINNMSEEELNEYIFFALKEMTKKCEEQQAEIKKKDKIIDEMASALKEYANLGFLIKCPAEYDGKYSYKYCKIDITKDRTAKTNRLCIDCIKEYFKKKVGEQNGFTKNN